MHPEWAAGPSWKQSLTSVCPCLHLLHHFDHLRQHCLQVLNCLMNQKLPSKEQSYYPQ